MKVIKKKFFELICVVALVFTSCASIPEPSQKNSSMFYGYAEIVPDELQLFWKTIKPEKHIQ